MSLKDRLYQLVEDEGLNPNQFYVKTGLGNGFLSTVGDKLRKPSIEKLEKAFPHWNMKWILTGEGDKFRKTAVVIEDATPEGLKESISETIGNAINEKLLEMFQKNEIVSSAQLKEKEEVIGHLREYIGKLQSLLEQNGIDYTEISQNIKKGVI